MENNHDDHELEESTLGSRSFGGGADHDDYPRIPRIQTAGDEMESICRAELESLQRAYQLRNGEEVNAPQNAPAVFVGFPQNVFPIVKLLTGNHCCVDCGDEDNENLVYGSIGYGTLLCKDCGYRHVTNTEEDSQIKSLTDDVWSFRSVLALLEGSNTQLLEYIKNKPRWRASKSSKTVNDTEDVVAFKQLYLSKGATTYRKLLAKKVQETYVTQLQSMKDDDEAKERIALMRSLPPPGPFDHIFRTMNVTPDQIPGFDNSYTSRLDISNSSRRPARRGGDIMASVNGGVRLAPKILQQEETTVELIQHKINMRRNMKINDYHNQNDTNPYRNGSIPVETAPLRVPGGPAYRRRSSVGEVGDASGNIAYRRRSSDMSLGLVGEVAEYSFQDHPVDNRHRSGDDDSIGYPLKPGMRWGMDEYSEAPPQQQQQRPVYRPVQN